VKQFRTREGESEKWKGRRSANAGGGEPKINVRLPGGVT